MPKGESSQDKSLGQVQSFLVGEANRAAQHALDATKRSGFEVIDELLTHDRDGTIYPEQGFGVIDEDSAVYATSDATYIPPGKFYDQILIALTADDSAIRHRPSFMMRTLSLQGSITPAVLHVIRRDQDGSRTVSVKQAAVRKPRAYKGDADDIQLVRSAARIIDRKTRDPKKLEVALGALANAAIFDIAPDPSTLFLKDTTRTNNTSPYRMSAPLRVFTDRINQRQYLAMVKNGLPYTYAPRQIAGIKSEIIDSTEPFDQALLFDAPELSVFTSIAKHIAQGTALGSQDVDALYEIVEVDPKAVWPILRWLRNNHIIDLSHAIEPTADTAATRRTLEAPVTITARSKKTTASGTDTVPSDTITLGQTSTEINEDFGARVLFQAVRAYNELPREEKKTYILNPLQNGSRRQSRSARSSMGGGRVTKARSKTITRLRI